MNNTVRRQAGISGILGGILSLVTSFMHFAAHGLDASPDYRVVLGLSQNVWFALGLAPFPFLLFALYATLRLLWRDTAWAARSWLLLAWSGLLVMAIGHFLQLLPHEGAWRTAFPVQGGWFIYVVGYLLFGGAVVLGALWVPRLPTTRDVRWPLLGFGLSSVLFIAGAFIDRDYGFESALLPTLLWGMLWVALGLGLKRQTVLPDPPSLAAVHRR